MSNEAEDSALWSIYSLRAEGDTLFSYVGLTHVGIDKRLELHKAAALTGTRPVHEWIRQNIDSIIAELVQECPVGDDDFIGKAEAYWIDYYRDLGHPLTNSKGGGAPGSYGKRWTLDDSRIRRGEDHPNYGRTFSAEIRASMGAQNIGRVRSEESRRRQGESTSGDNHWKRKSGYVMPEETRAKLAEASRGRTASPETRQKISDARRGQSPTPEALANMRASFRRGENHHAFGKPAVNRGVPASEEAIAKNRASAPARSCKVWHVNRGYADPDCVVCTERVESGEIERFSTPEEIEAAKAEWKAGRDTTELSARLSAQRTGRVTSEETKAKLSAASKGVKRGPMSDEAKRAMSEAASKRRDSDETKRIKREGSHRRWHVGRGIVNPDCEFCVDQKSQVDL